MRFPIFALLLWASVSNAQKLPNTHGMIDTVDAKTMRVTRKLINRDKPPSILTIGFGKQSKITLDGKEAGFDALKVGMAFSAYVGPTGFAFTFAARTVQPLPEAFAEGDLRFSITGYSTMSGSIGFGFANISETKILDVSGWGATLASARITDDLGNTYKVTESNLAFDSLRPEKTTSTHLNHEALVGKAKELRLEMVSPSGKAIKWTLPWPNPRDTIPSKVFR